MARRYPWRRRWHPTPVLLSGKSHRWRSLVGCSPWGCEESDMTSLSLSTFRHWRRKWQPTPVFLPGESQERGSLVGCRLWGGTESDTTEATQQQQQIPWWAVQTSSPTSELYRWEKQRYREVKWPANWRNTREKRSHIMKPQVSLLGSSDDISHLLNHVMPVFFPPHLWYLTQDLANHKGTPVC